MFTIHRNKGFTLIELLVVISIIGILASVVLASLSTARVKAQDSKRISELIQLTNALELYRLDKGTYPSANPTYVDNIVGLAPKYIPILPKDPTNTGVSRYRYASDNFKLGYTILVDLKSDDVLWCRINSGHPGVAAWESGYPLCKQ